MEALYNLVHQTAHKGEVENHESNNVLFSKQPIDNQNEFKDVENN